MWRSRRCGCRRGEPNRSPDEGPWSRSRQRRGQRPRRARLGGAGGREPGRRALYQRRRAARRKPTRFGPADADRNNQRVCAGRRRSDRRLPGGPAARGAYARRGRDWSVLGAVLADPARPAREICVAGGDDRLPHGGRRRPHPRSVGATGRLRSSTGQRTVSVLEPAQQPRDHPLADPGGRGAGPDPRRRPRAQSSPKLVVDRRDDRADSSRPPARLDERPGRRRRRRSGRRVATPPAP
jgi:hypothetical protein